MMPVTAQIILGIMVFLIGIGIGIWLNTICVRDSREQRLQRSEVLARARELQERRALYQHFLQKRARRAERNQTKD
jgi:hypothetical protein